MTGSMGERYPGAGTGGIGTGRSAEVDCRRFTAPAAGRTARAPGPVHPRGETAAHRPQPADHQADADPPRTPQIGTESTRNGRARASIRPVQSRSTSPPSSSCPFVPGSLAIDDGNLLRQLPASETRAENGAASASSSGSVNARTSRRAASAASRTRNGMLAVLC